MKPSAKRSLSVLSLVVFLVSASPVVASPRRDNNSEGWVSKIVRIIKRALPISALDGQDMNFPKP